MTWRLLQGNAEERLRALPEGSVQCCVTSPPYFNLRSYLAAGDEKKPLEIGLEETPEKYIERLVAIFAGVWRVLRDDGTLWVVIGDSYAATHQGKHGKQHGAGFHSTGEAYSENVAVRRLHAIPSGLKSKDLIGIPWALAFALRGAGWYLRSEIVWAKSISGPVYRGGSCMPEAVTDRPTKSHETIFLLSKQARYFFDHEAIKEPAHDWSRGGPGAGIKKTTHYTPDSGGNAGLGQLAARYKTGTVEPKRNMRSVWHVNPKAFKGAHFACVDSETECLTPQGWCRFDALAVGDVIAQFDMTAERASWAPVEAIAAYPVEEQPVVVAQSRDLRMVLSPNHRVLARTRHNVTRQWGRLRVVRADEVKRHHAIPVSSAWEGSWIEPMSPEWAELLGWYIAEGCETATSWSVEIYQSKAANPEKVDRIRSLLHAVGAEFLEATAPRIWRGRDSTMTAFQVRGFAAAFLRQWAPKKHIPQGVLCWSDRLLQSLLDGLVDGDGHRRPDGRFSFIQRSRESSDVVQAMGVRLGFSVTISWRSEGTCVVYFTRKRHISLRGTAGTGAKIEQESYTGTLWCPKTPAGAWIARKNGRVFITGNTFPPELITPMVLAGSRPGDTVLDPFAGAGTTLVVAAQHGRSAIGIELNPEYVELAKKRLDETQCEEAHEKLPDEEPVDVSRVCWGEDNDDEQERSQKE